MDDDGDNGRNGVLSNNDNNEGTIERLFSFLPDIDTDDVFENFPVLFKGSAELIFGEFS